MSDNILSNSQYKKQVKTEARNKVLLQISSWLQNQGFQKEKGWLFTQQVEGAQKRVWFQFRSNALTIQVWSSCQFIGAPKPVDGPVSNLYGKIKKGCRYDFRCSNEEKDIKRCASEYCRYIEEIVFPWFTSLQ